MNEDFLPVEFDLYWDRHKPKSRTKWSRRARHEEEGFRCAHCHADVSSVSFLSGVVNRNHCPYCLWSRHLDLYAAGDRLSACKAKMQPVGVTLKKTRKKYGSQNGELMIVHLCLECEKVSLNRIAADDIATTIFEVYESSLQMAALTRACLAHVRVQTLGQPDLPLVEARLFGEGQNAAPVQPALEDLLECV